MLAMEPEGVLLEEKGKQMQMKCTSVTEANVSREQLPLLLVLFDFVR